MDEKRDFCDCGWYKGKSHETQDFTTCPECGKGPKITKDTAFDEIKSTLKKDKNLSDEEAGEQAGKILSSNKKKKERDKESFKEERERLWGYLEDKNISLYKKEIKRIIDEDRKNPERKIERVLQSESFVNPKILESILKKKRKLDDLSKRELLTLFLDVGNYYDALNEMLKASDNYKTPEHKLEQKRIENEKRNLRNKIDIMAKEKGFV